MIPKEQLRQLYLVDRLSMRQIARKFGCSQHKISYWMKQYSMTGRNLSEAAYLKHNPTGDPFNVRKPRNEQEIFLKGLALGLFWNENSRASRSSIKFSSDQPAAVSAFKEFLTELCGADKTKLRLGLHIFADIPKEEAIKYWSKTLNISADQFYKVTVRSSRGAFQNTDKNRYGILTLYFHNKKLRDIIVGLLPT